MWSPYRPVQHRGMYLRCASICTQTAYLIFDIWPVDSLPDLDQCDLIWSVPAKTAHTLLHSSSQHPPSNRCYPHFRYMLFVLWMWQGFCENVGSLLVSTATYGRNFTAFYHLPN